MSAPTSSTPPSSLDPAERSRRELITKAVLWIALIDLLLFLPLIYGLAAGDDSFSPIFGPLHGTGFVIELGLVGYGAINGWWGWWYPAVTLITTGPPGAILGHAKAKREALG
jgi:hypothetical protein